MKYREYYNTAVRHLNSCDAFLKSVDWTDPNTDKKNALRDVYYLSGYILEAFAVFIIYKYGGFSENSDIDEFNYAFTRKTNVDYFPRSRKGNGYQTKRKYAVPKKNIILLPADEKFLNTLSPLYAIEQHHFQYIVQQIRTLIPSLNIPYFVNAMAISRPVDKLIKSWKSSIRYSSDDDLNVWTAIDPILTEGNMKDLINICKIIQKNI